MKVNLLVSGLCGKFGYKLFTASFARTMNKNAGIAGPASILVFINKANAAMVVVTKISDTEFSKQLARVIER